MQGRAQAGVTWRSETLFQEQVGLPTERIDIPDEQNATGIYAGAVVKDPRIRPRRSSGWTSS